MGHEHAGGGGFGMTDSETSWTSDWNTGMRQRDAQLIQIMDAALADATRRAGDHLACRPGCSQCCHGAFAINALDAMRLRMAMAELAAANPGQAAKIELRAQIYLAEHGASFPGDRVTGILGASKEAEEAFDEFANEAACPALDPETGCCDLYESRPMACRVFGPPVRINRGLAVEMPAEDSPGISAIGTGSAGENVSSTEESGFAVCELCFTVATPDEVEAAEMWVPREEEQLVLEEFEKLQEAGKPQEAGESAVFPAGQGANAGNETIVAFCLLPLPTPNTPPTAF